MFLQRGLRVVIFAQKVFGRFAARSCCHVLCLAVSCGHRVGEGVGGGGEQSVVEEIRNDNR